MILPIQSLFNRPGLPGIGVPPMSIDPTSGKILGDSWPQGAVGVDPITGEIVTKENTRSAFSASGPGAASSTVDITDWDSGEPAPVSPPLILNTAAIRDTHGTPWNYTGSHLTDSVFDRWRRAGRPSACQKLNSGCGMGDYTFPDGTPCDPGMSDPRLCLNTTVRIIDAVTAGAMAANNQLQYGNYGGGYPPPIPGGGSVTVSGQASPGAWIFGGLIVAGLVYAVAKR